MIWKIHCKDKNIKFIPLENITKTKGDNEFFLMKNLDVKYMPNRKPIDNGNDFFIIIDVEVMQND